MCKVKTAILISGGGSNMEALIKASNTSDYPAKITLVISNRPNAGGLLKARNLGIKTIVIDHKNYDTRQGFEREMHKALRVHNIQLICNAGFMRLLTPWFVNKWLGWQLNIHPSLLPKYKGLHTHQRVLDADDSHHGCTVHYVSEGMDDGKILGQSKVTIKPDDTIDILAARVLIEEHKLYPEILYDVAKALK